MRHNYQNNGEKFSMCDEVCIIFDFLVYVLMIWLHASCLIDIYNDGIERGFGYREECLCICARRIMKSKKGVCLKGGRDMFAKGGGQT